MNNFPVLFVDSACVVLQAVLLNRTQLKTTKQNIISSRFPESKWNPTFVLFMKGCPIKRRGHPHHKEGPHPLKRRRLDTYRN